MRPFFLLQLSIAFFLLSAGSLLAQGQIVSGTPDEQANAKVVPDLLRPANVSWGYVILPNHPLQTGDKLCVANCENSAIVTVTAVYPNGFQIDSDYSGCLYLYGRLREVSLPSAPAARKRSVPSTR